MPEEQQTSSNDKVHIELDIPAEKARPILEQLPKIQSTESPQIPPPETSLDPSSPPAEPAKIAGYKVSDLIAAPVKPPAPALTDKEKEILEGDRSPKAVVNDIVKKSFNPPAWKDMIVVGIGLVLLLLGLFIVFAHFALAMVFFAIGLIAIVVGVFMTL